MASDAIYQAFVDVIPSGRNLRKSLAKEFASAGPEVGRDAGKGINSGILGSVGKLAAPLAAAFAGIGIGRIIGDSISSAADLEQSVGAIDAVFKGSADQMHKWSSTAATDVGLTKNEFNELGTLIGAQLKNGGTAMDQLAPKTHDLIGLGADLSSMFGGTTADAVGALSSALKGERDPIEKYGVSLTQAKIDAEAASLGFAKVGGSLSSEANQAATLSLIMKQTADAHGNFASEADTLSHKQQVLNAVWADGKAQIGTALLPAVSALTGMLTGLLGPALAGVADGMNWVRDAISLVKGSFTGLGADVDLGGWTNPLIDLGATLRTLADSVGPLFGSLGASIGPLLPQLVELWQAFSPLSLVLKAIGPQLPVLAGALASLASSLAGALVGALSSLLPSLTLFSGVLVDLIGGLLSSVLPILTGLATFLATNTQVVLAFAVGIGAAVLAFQLYSATMAIVRAATAAWAAVQAALNVVMSLNPIGIVILAIVALVAAIVWVATQTTFFQDAWAVMVQVFTSSIGMFKDFFTNTIGMFVDFFNNTVGMFKDFGVKAGRLVGGFVSNTVGMFSGFVSNTTGMFSDFWSNTVGMFRDGVGHAVGFIAGLPGKILDALSGLGGLLVDLGGNMIQGLIDGASGLLSNLGSFFLDIVPAWIREPFKAALGIHSPSRVFAGFGENTMQGYINGIEGMGSKVDRTLSGAVSVPRVPQFDSASSGVGAGSAVADRPMVQIINKTGVRLSDLIDVRIEANGRAQYLALGNG